MTNEEFIQSIALEGEEWKTIPNWERYAASTYGRILAYSSPYMQAGIPRYRKPQLLKPRFVQGNPGYWEVVLSNGNGVRKAILVHRLIALTFIPNPNNYPIVNHKDENSSNNCVDNLEWCTQRYNTNYGSHNIRMSKTLSETGYQRRAVVQLTLQNEYIAQYGCIKDAASAIGKSAGAISFCCRKINPTCAGYRWMYLSDYESLINKSKNSLPAPITAD